MKSRYIVNRVRQAAATRLIFALIPTLLLAWIGISMTNYFLRTSQSPATILAQSDLENFDASARLYNVQVQGREMFDTGFESRQTNAGIEYNHYYFGALLVGSRLLLIQSSNPIDPSQLNYVGMLSYASENLRENIVLKIVDEQPELYGVFVPLVLDISNIAIWYSVGQILIICLWLLAFVTCLWYLGSAIYYLWRPQAHSIMKALSRYGDLYEVMAEIEGEVFFGSEKIEKLGSIKVSQNWIVYDFLGSFDAVRFDSIVWFHKRIMQTQYRSNFAGTYTTTIGGIDIYDNTGHKTLIASQLFATDIILDALLEHAPNAVVGFSPQALNMWEKQQASFIETVEKRKNELDAATDQA